MDNWYRRPLYPLKPCRIRIVKHPRLECREYEAEEDELGHYFVEGEVVWKWEAVKLPPK